MAINEKKFNFSKPWIFIDDVLEVNDNGIVTQKNISYSDVFLQGHFLSYSVYPGMLLLEGIKQSIFIWKTESSADPSTEIYQIRSQARFLHPVRPGNIVIYEISAFDHGNEEWTFMGTGTVGNIVVTRFSMIFLDHNGGKGGVRICRNRT
ncbi:3-hydroxyacyl-ACP dehydratase FabZ family protein [Cohnella soli]|uniref:3-hydroxyacyl-ACP dehydratase FabZ family protein n=1 Tax=Cohnella soli TaxID=425005 RepID=A0ABW0I486_9BACL